MEKNLFFKIIEAIYSDVKIHSPESDQYFGVKDALNVYMLVDKVIPVLLSANKNNQDTLEDCLNRFKFKTEELIKALKKVKIFPELNFHHLNQNKFFELRKFLEFIKYIQFNPKIYRKGQNISLIDQSSKCWKLDHDDYAKEFLKEYLLYRYENQYAQATYITQYELAVQSFSDKQDQMLKEFELYVEQDIQALVKQVGLLYIFVAKIRFKPKDKKTSNFSKINNKKFKLLDCLKTTYGDKNIDELTERYAPPKENNTAAYINFCAKKQASPMIKKSRILLQKNFKNYGKLLSRWRVIKKELSQEFIL